jgi:hypothetical protein
MSTTIRESILENIKTTLAAIVAGETYNNTIASVERYKSNGNDLINVPCIIITAGPETKTPSPNPLYTCKLTVFIDIWNRQDETDTQATDTILDSLLGDIEKALMIDITRGGYAIDTNFLGNIPFDTVEGSPHIGITISVEIIYQHLWTDPASAG